MSKYGLEGDSVNVVTWGLWATQGPSQLTSMTGIARKDHMANQALGLNTAAWKQHTSITSTHISLAKPCYMPYQPQMGMGKCYLTMCSKERTGVIAINLMTTISLNRLFSQAGTKNNFSALLNMTPRTKIGKTIEIVFLFK